MNRNLKIFVAGIFLSGVLMAPALSFARDHRQWSRGDNRWDHRFDRRDTRQEFEQARQQLDYDLSHHASRKKLAQDDARVKELNRELRINRWARR